MWKLINRLQSSKNLLVFLVIITPVWVEATPSSLITMPPNIGNYSLATSQQPGPFFSFGQNIVDKNQWIISYNPSYLYSLSQKITEGSPSLLYGITNSSSLLLTLPYAINYKNGPLNLSGMGDLTLDLEYAFYNKENSRYSDQATLVVSTTIPTRNLDKMTKQENRLSRISGFSKKNAPSSLNAASYFLGATYSRTLTDWYGFAAPGLLLIDNDGSIQQGTQYYYNLGIGHDIKSVTNQYLLFGLIELNGQYSDKTKQASQTIPNTGGAILYVTPSLWFSTPRIVIQIGISLPINQYWYGNQSAISYYAGSIITWTLNQS